MQLNIWRFVDGNRAHEKQSAALLSGLRECLGEDAVVSHDIGRDEWTMLPWRSPSKRLRQLPAPQFIIGAGHHCHWPMLMARRAFGGRTVVIMRPSLPVSWFDFAIIPEHDRPAPLANVILSQGALTEPLPRDNVRAGRGLILLGGPSKHFAWDPIAVRNALSKLQQQPLQWVVSDSRRTPEGALRSCTSADAELWHWEDCPPGWIAEQLSEAEQVWVTGDSISMVFEALQSEARVGIIPLPSRRSTNKVRAAVQRLVDQGRISDRVGVPGPKLPPLSQQVVCARALLRRCGLCKGIDHEQEGAACDE